MTDPVCVLTGAGAGTGASIARRFAQGGYRVAMLARSADRLAGLEAEIAGSRAYPCDVSDLDALREVLARVKGEMGAPRAAIHNAAMGGSRFVLEGDALKMEKMFRVNTTALLVLAQETVPDMIEAGEGSIVVTGNTAAWRGKPHFSHFAPTKASQRILAEAMARDFGPKGVHVAYVTIDAAIDTPWTRPMIFPDKSDDFFAKPSAIAEEVFHVAHQDRSAWSFAVEVRPFGETW